jgi:hypothetical protein
MESVSLSNNTLSMRTESDTSADCDLVADPDTDPDTDLADGG